MQQDSRPSAANENENFQRVAKNNQKQWKLQMQ